MILRAALIPMLFAVLGLHARKRRGSYHPLTRTGQVSSQTETRNRVIGARVNVKRNVPDNPEQQVNVSVRHDNDIPRKTDEELRQDAEELEGLLVDLYGPQAKGWYTVATAQDANGNLYYTVSNNDVDQYLRIKTEEMGYNRVHGADVENDGQSHAEQILMNALDEKKKADDNGYGDAEPYRSLPVEPVRLSPGKPPCDDTRAPEDPKNQGCRERSGDRLVGW
jgi:hypothetical protein